MVRCHRPLVWIWSILERLSPVQDDAEGRGFGRAGAAQNREAAGSGALCESEQMGGGHGQRLRRGATFQGVTWVKPHTNLIVSGSTSTQTNCRPESRKPKTKRKTHQTRRRRDRVARVAGPESAGPRRVRFDRP